MDFCKISDVLADWYCGTHKRHVNECRSVLEHAVLDAARDVVTEAQDLPTHRSLREALAALDALEALYRMPEREPQWPSLPEPSPPITSVVIGHERKDGQCAKCGAYHDLNTACALPPAPPDEREEEATP